MNRPKPQHCAILVVSVVCLLSSSTPAATWTVAKDGSGDFTVIQDAIDAAASGDVIQIGPGRYEEHRIVTTVNGGVGDLYVYVNHANLTLEGAGSALTIIGPTISTQSQYGLAQDVDSQQLTIRALGFENSEYGLFAGGDNLTVENCRFESCRIGLDSAALYVTTVIGSVFRRNTGDGILLGRLPLGTPQSSIVSGCTFEDNFSGFLTQFPTNQINDCSFSGGVVPLNFQSGGSTTITNTTAMDFSWTGMDIRGGASVTATELVIGPGQANLILAGGHFSGDRVTFAGGSLYTISANASSNAVIQNSHILNGGGWSFQVGGTHTLQTFDLRENWWGSTDAAQIAAWIDPGIHNVFYEPFVGMPIPTEKCSFGELKAKYGPGN